MKLRCTTALLALLAASSAGSDRPSVAPLAPTGAASYPDTRPSIQDAAAMRERAEARLKKLRAKYGDALHYSIDEQLRIVFATAMDDHGLEETRQIMAAHARALSRDLFDHPPAGYLSVVIPAKWSNERVTGHFYPPDFIDARTIGANLKHEFTHALHFADQQARGQEHPVWVMEGLASLYENSTIVDGHSVPQVDHSLGYLQQQIRQHASQSFEKITHLEHRQFTSHQYPQAHYMFLYLYQTGNLKQWYEAYTADFAHDASGAAALEKTFGKSLAEVEKAWADWALHLAGPAASSSPAGFRMAIRQVPDGLEIDRLPAAGEAGSVEGLAPHDVLLSVGPTRVVEPPDLMDALAPHKPGDKVKVRYRRDGQYAEATITLVPLKAPPPAE